MLSILGLLYGNPTLRGEPTILLTDGTSLPLAPETVVTVDGLVLPRLRDDGFDRKLGLLAWVTTAADPTLVSATSNGHIYPTAVTLASTPPVSP